jgi:hypothetical protein
MFSKHRVDNKRIPFHLFRCDDTAQQDYVIFSDADTFDATYKRYKYMGRLVVFFGVNHHNQSIAFWGVVMCDETEETYVLYLEQFLSWMSGKSPTFVITDGDLTRMWLEEFLQKITANYVLDTWNGRLALMLETTNLSRSSNNVCWGIMIMARTKVLVSACSGNISNYV